MELSRRLLERQGGAQERQDQSPDSGEKPWPMLGRTGFPRRSTSMVGPRSQSRACNDSLPGENHVSGLGAPSCAQSSASNSGTVIRIERRALCPWPRAVSPEDAEGKQRVPFSPALQPACLGLSLSSRKKTRLGCSPPWFSLILHVCSPPPYAPDSIGRKIKLESSLERALP